MVNYNELQSSIESAVDQYENYKSQSLRVKLDNISLESPSISSPTKTHNKRASLAIPGFQRTSSARDSTARPPNIRVNSSASINSQRALQSPKPVDSPRTPGSPSAHASTPSHKEFAAFIQIATNFESADYLFDLEFLLQVVEFMRSEHPYTSKSLQQSIKQRHTSKKKLWTNYTTDMQSLARAYTNKKPLPSPSTSSPLNSASAIQHRQRLKETKLTLVEAVRNLDKNEQTCAESILSALSHLHTQAKTDILARYNMPDPINDKTTSITLHNERVRIFNQLIKFVVEDLRRIEQDIRNSGQNGLVPERRKDKKGSGVVEAVDSLCVEDYPPYK